MHLCVHMDSALDQGHSLVGKDFHNHLGQSWCLNLRMCVYVCDEWGGGKRGRPIVPGSVE